MTDVTIRIARPEEHARALQAYEAWGYDGGVRPEDAVYLAEAGDELVGVVRRTREHGHTMLRGMQVAPEWRGLGVGSRLLRALVADLRPGEECYCIPYAHLTGFYGAAGFREIGEADTPAFLRERLAGYLASGLSVLVMRRPGDAPRGPGDEKLAHAPVADYGASSGTGAWFPAFRKRPASSGSLRPAQDDHLERNPMGKRDERSQSDQDNHANQLNPNNDAYWQSRGEDERPDDWAERVAREAESER